MRDLLHQAGSILFLSIKPRFVRQLLNGTKSTELRRIKPRVQNGDIVLIYETSPTMALVGYGIVDMVVTAAPSHLWKEVGSKSGVSKAEFNEYYCGATVGYAINFSSTFKLSQAVSLISIKEKIDGFHPPQSYRYLCPIQATSICLGS
ncbi:MAG: hypothetical protein L3J26_06825 [Candidatus Polarisedimenticolaceae bacterium]|nr:hypothetical protein [Candidatus Polarisedimenticolaceae bacterium]